MIHGRLRRFPVSRGEAAFWTRAFSNYPSVFRGFGADLQYVAEVFPGISMKLGYRDRIQKTIIATGEWDPRTAATLKQLLRPGDTFIDIGANIGYFSLLASTIVGSAGRVFAFEPSVRALAKLTDHLQSNAIRNVLVNSVAVADRRSLLTFYQANEGNIGKSSLGLGEKERHESETVLAVALDEYLADIEITPQVIKIDVEGAEVAAITGMRGLLEKHRPFVLCEVVEAYLNRLGATGAELFAMMRDLGYQAYFPVGESNDSWQPTEVIGKEHDNSDILFAARKVPDALLEPFRG